MSCLAAVPLRLRVGDGSARLLLGGALRSPAHDDEAEGGEQPGAEEQRERGQEDDAGEDASDDPAERDHPGRFSLRKDSTSEAGTSLAMKAWPMPRVRMKVSAPRVTFLSCAM